MSSEVDLLPCPFCGGYPVASDRTIWCPNRDCWGPNVENYANMSDAIAAWNRRSASPSIGRVGVDWRAAIAKVRNMLGQAGGTGTAGVQNSIIEREVGGWVLDAVEDELSAVFATLVYHEEPAGDTQGADHIADAGKMVEPSYADLRSVIEKSRDRVVAGGGWSLTSAETDIALEWMGFLEGIGAPCPKISGFDEGLQLVWDNGQTRHYLALGADDEDSFVMKIDRKQKAAQP